MAMWPQAVLGMLVGIIGRKLLSVSLGSGYGTITAAAPQCVIIAKSLELTLSRDTVNSSSKKRMVRTLLADHFATLELYIHIQLVSRDNHFILFGRKVILASVAKAELHIKVVEETPSMAILRGHLMPH